jgi:pyruvate dehydrogenase (quinone)
VDYAGWAELLGFTGLRIRNDDEAGAVWDQALANPGVTLVDAYVSKNVPPLPPRISREYAKNTVTSFLKGDPFELGAVRDSAQALASEGIERVKGALHLNRDE